MDVKLDSSALCLICIEGENGIERIIVAVYAIRMSQMLFFVVRQIRFQILQIAAVGTVLNDPKMLAEIVACPAVFDNPRLEHRILVMLDLQKTFHRLTAGVGFQLFSQLLDKQDHEMAD